MDIGGYEQVHRRHAHAPGLELVQIRREEHSQYWCYPRYRAAQDLPAIGVLDYVWQEYFRKVKWVSFLDLLDYRKEEALQVLERECGYRRYPYKHYESIFTRFYQGYILPRKFGIDKRKLHLATLVATGQMSRDDALRLLAEIPYPSQAELDSDRQYFLKKMNWTEQQLDEYIARPEKSHAVYGTELGLWQALAKVYKQVFGKPKAI